MDIVLIYDDNYKKYAEITEKSILKHNPDAKLHRIKSVSDEFIKEFIGIDNNLHPTNICYAKLFIQDLLPDLDKVLYLDTDLIVLNDLTGLYNMAFDDNYIIGCESHDFGKIQASELGIPKYLNSGVMLLDLKAMRKNKVSDYVRANFKPLVNKVKTWIYDETIINGLLYDKVKFIPEEWNYCINRKYNGREVKEPKIIHYIGADKSGMLEWQKQ